MTVHTLAANVRTVSGKASKTLRAKGMTPATVYGKGMDSVNVQVNTEELARLFATTGHSTVVEVTTESVKYPCLIAAVQRDPVTHAVIHAEFRKVNLKEKIKANVPVDFVGEPVAVKEFGGILLSIVNEVEVEALPNDLPERFSVDVSGLATIDAQLTVKDIPASQGVAVLTDPELVIAKVVEKQKEEPVEQPAATAAEGATAEAGQPAEPAEETKQEA